MSSCRLLLALAIGAVVVMSSRESGQTTVRILHLSDTHNLHDSIESTFPMPAADILIHTGDFTNFGKDAEFASVNEWLGKLTHRYKHIIGILGNHDWIEPEHSLSAKVTSNPKFWKSRLSNLNLLQSESVSVMGLSIFGSSWKAGQSHGNPEGFGKIPSGVDMVLTHGPAYGILDLCGNAPWGSSKELLQHLGDAKPKIHLFGHVHEQRGVWQREHDAFVGGVEYRPAANAQAYRTTSPPAEYPLQMISNNAMMNQPKLEWSGGGTPWPASRIAGPARLIIATRSEEHGEWQFSTEMSDCTISVNISEKVKGNTTCGDVKHPKNAKCMESVTQATRDRYQGGNTSMWFDKMIAIAGVNYTDASQDDIQRLHFCLPPSEATKCDVPPCTCSKPPCGQCSA